MTISEREWSWADVSDLDGAETNNEVDQFGTMYRTMEHFTRHQMDTFLGFMRASTLGQEHREYLAELVPIGIFQYTAAVNLRYGRLKDLRLQLQGALEVAGYGELMGETEPWEEDAIMAPLPLTEPTLKDLDRKAKSVKPISSEWLGAEVMPNPARRCLELIGAIVTLQRGIQRDTVRGVFRDYTRVHEHFAEAKDLAEIYDGGIIQQLPSFLLKAFEVCEEGRIGTGDQHNQSLLARMVASLSVLAQSNQRGAQKGQHKGAKDDDE